MITFHDFVAAFRKIGLVHSTPVIVHASLSAFGEVQGGAETALGALMYVYDTILMPAFTYKTMVVPEEGPPDNGLTYGESRDANLMAQFFRPGMPVDRLMGAIPEALRRHPRARRSFHPILSFAGVNAESFLKSQTLAEPLKPLEGLAQAGGWALLMGVDHAVNTSLHLAERLAGRKTFTRWALTPQGVVECPGFPGCSEGFEQIAPHLKAITRQALVGLGVIRAAPLDGMIAIAKDRIKADPLALLCERSYCDRCLAVRKWVSEGNISKSEPLAPSATQNDEFRSDPLGGLL